MSVQAEQQRIAGLLGQLGVRYSLLASFVTERLVEVARAGGMSEVELRLVANELEELLFDAKLLTG